MDHKVLGLHHVTAIATEAKRNLDFYTRILGQRLVKKTVNFDDPNTYHLYYGDKQGSPGTIMTFFPWVDVQAGSRGTQQVTEVGYSVPSGSLDFWLERFKENGIIYNNIAEKFGEKYLTIIDPSGLKLELTVSKHPDNRIPWETEEIKAEHATKGFHHVTITTNDVKPTEEVLTHILGYKLAESHVNRFRYSTDAVDSANLIDVVEALGEKPGNVAGGSVHHVAFRVKDENSLLHIRQKVVDAGLHITEKIDRNYFYSLYFREPGGVLFEIATDNPGFDVDEPMEHLGEALKLPAKFENNREEILKKLPALT